MFAKIKLNSIETLISQELIDMDVSHEEFITVLKEKDRNDERQFKSENGESYEILRFSTMKSKI